MSKVFVSCHQLHNYYRYICFLSDGVASVYMEGQGDWDLDLDCGGAPPSSARGPGIVAGVHICI